LDRKQWQGDSEDAPVKSLDQLLYTLEQTFDYQGRLPSFSVPPHDNQQQIQAPENDDLHRCGFVALVGAPNMGKSTLLNALLQEQLCVATHRPQTTRHAILGVLTSPVHKCQICFVDTPGVIENPAYKLQEGMMEAVKGAFYDADVLLVVTDLFSTPIPDDALFQRVKSFSQTKEKKVIIAINKIDLIERVNVTSTTPKTLFHNMQRDSNRNHNDGDGYLVALADDDVNQFKRTLNVSDAVANWRELVPAAVAIIPLCADNGVDDLGVVALRTLLLGGDDVPKAFRDLGRPVSGMFLPGAKTISNQEAKEIIPVSPPLYDGETLTDRNSR